MDKPFDAAARLKVSLVAFAVLACASTATIAAGPEPSKPEEAGTADLQLEEQAPVKIHRKINLGDLPYKPFFSIQTYLQSLLPPEPRSIDLLGRVHFVAKSEVEKDLFAPESWAVAVVGNDLDQVVPVHRGGYFLLPEVKLGMLELGTIMFNTQTQKGKMSVAWKVRIPHTQALSYAEFAKALEEVAFVQRQIPTYRYDLREIRRHGHNALRACFLNGQGRIEVDGRPAPTIPDGACQVLKYDPAVARAGLAQIAFVGKLDLVTLKEVVSGD
ncbi:hypothetical protein [Massilia sp. BSC265]|uniref:hypothetical protein n=1 Tax=Massilia sp. BSC265 TaxID=1549812 RepID=UPI0004E94710|nr:hypothetical protein [Massilia sp. BSC265]KFI06986.1 hypothetical protein JN27_15230 [Massilia sp. BSC265]